MSTIVVGIDESDHAQCALEWAVGEARVRDAQLVVAHAEQFPLMLQTPVAAMMAAETMVVDRAADTTVERALQRVDTTGVEVEERSVPGHAVEVLIKSAHECSADLLVVGSRARGGVVGLLRGSVATTLARHAPCPLVIVPGRDAG